MSAEPAPERTVKGKTSWLTERDKSGRVVRDVEPRGGGTVQRPPATHRHGEAQE